MKICFVHRHHPPEGRGGICSYISTLAQGLAADGHVVHIVARAEAGGDRTEQDGAVTVHRLAALAPSGWASRILEGFGHAARQCSGVFVNRLLAARRIAGKLDELIRAGEVDLVEGAEWEAELIWRLRHRRDAIPTVVKLHGPMEIVREANNLPDDRAFRCLAGWEREQTLLADCVSSPSRHLAEEMARRWGLDLKRIEVIPYPIDAALFSPGAKDRPNDPPVILFVGRIEPNKGADVLFKAIPHVLSQHPSVRFRFVGSDTPSGKGGNSYATEQMNELPGHCRSNIEWVGPKPRNELVGEYRRARVFCIPSRFDNFPNTCLEAMACGVAVVGSDAGGIREMIAPNDAGILFPVGDSDRLSEALVELLSSSNHAEELGQRARRRVEEVYALEKIVQRTVSFYQETIARWKS